jgi:hypothetical protein
MKHRGFFFVSMLTIGIVFLFGLALQLFLISFGEYPSLRDITRVQNEQSFIYNGLRHQFDEYKRSQFLLQKPEIVSIGSSRSFDIRGYFFKNSYYGLGGSIDTPLRARIYSKLLFTKHKPQLLIYSLDFWGFCHSAPDYAMNLQLKKKELINFYNKKSQFEESFSLLTSLLMGKLISPKELGDLVRRRYKSGGLEYIGISAYNSRNGFGPDGSIYKFKQVAKKISPLLENKPIEKHSGGQYRLKSDCRLNQNAITDLIKFLEEMKVHGIKVVVFLAPLPKAVITRLLLRGEEYDYIWELRKTLSYRLKGLSEYYDFLNADSFEAPDCEFRDFLHGGELTYLRLFNAILLKKRSILNKYIDIRTVQNLIRTYPGYRMIAADNVGKRYIKLLEKQRLC